MELNEITGVVQAYREILLEEWGAIAILASWDITVLSHKAAAIEEGDESGAINFQNAGTRKVQEAQILKNDEAYQKSLEERINLRNNMKQLEIERKCMETRISLLRAWLYSQSNLEAR